MMKKQQNSIKPIPIPSPQAERDSLPEQLQDVSPTVSAIKNDALEKDENCSRL